MKIKHISITLVALTFVLAAPSLRAGNEDRVGQAGGTELLINPCARSAGWAGANTSMPRGLEAQFLNVAGTAFTKNTEVLFSRSGWMGGSGISINAFGLSQGIGEDKTGTLSLSIMTMNFGDIMVTTVDQPEGGIGTFRPNLTNIGLSYAKEFSNAIYGGIAIRTVNQSISDVRASGICFDAGVQYVTGKTDNLRFGISLRNVGPRMRFNGDGLSFKGTLPETGASLTVEQRSESFEMPSLLNIGGAYIFNKMENHEISIAANFTSNSFSKDQVQGGLEYAFKKMFMVRAGYMAEISSSANDSDDLTVSGRTNAFTGPTAGFSIEAPLNKKGSTFSIDYAYRATNPFNGVHTIGARINL